MTVDFSAVSNASPWAYLVIFLAGVVTSLGPCNIAMIPLVVAFVGGMAAYVTVLWLADRRRLVMEYRTIRGFLSESPGAIE